MYLRPINKVHISLWAVHSDWADPAGLCVRVHALDGQHAPVIEVFAVITSPVTVPGAVVNLIDALKEKHRLSCLVSDRHLL